MDLSVIISMIYYVLLFCILLFLLDSVLMPDSLTLDSVLMPDSLTVT